MLDMIETRERTRSGHHAAMSWADPHRRARDVGGGDVEPVEQSDAVWCVERPTSRLS